LRPTRGWVLLRGYAVSAALILFILTSSASFAPALARGGQVSPAFAAAGADPPALSLSAVTGAVGSSTTATGTGYTAGTTTTFSICFSISTSSPCYSGFPSTFVGTSPTGALGATGTGVSFTIPQVTPSLYWVQIVSGSTIVAQVGFTVNPLNEVLTPSFGPEATSIGVAANNLTPNGFYDVCFSAYATQCTGTGGWIATIIIAQATGTGALSAADTVPTNAVQGAYYVNLFPDGSPSNVLASMPFLVTPEAVSLSVMSGNVGSSTTATGNGFAPSTVGTYSICFSISSGSPCYSGFSSSPIATSSTGTLGASGTGVSFTIPQVTPSLYWVQIVSGSNIIAQAGFTVNPLNEALSPSSGPEGTSIGVSANDLTPTQPYHVCFSLYSTSCNGTTGWTSPQVLAIATVSGTIAATLAVPPQATQGTYYVNLYQSSPTTVLATTSFLVTPESILATPNTGTSGTSVSVTGGGFAPSTTSTYSVCFSISSGSPCYSGFASTFVATSPAGDLGATGTGVTFTVPTVSPNGAYFLQIVSLGAVIAQTGFGYGQAGPPTLSISPTSGNVGSSLTATGTGYTPSTTTTYAICLSQYVGNVCYNFASTSTTIATSSTGALGASGTGVSFTIPQVVTGTYFVQIVQGSIIVSQTAFGIDPSGTITPNVGPDGTVITVGATNLTPNAFYDACFSLYASSCSGTTGWSSSMVIAQASGGGVLSASIAIPAQVVGGTYSVNVFPDGFPSNVVAAMPFFVTPEAVSLSPTFANIGSSIAVTGTGYAPNAVGTYSICFTQYLGNVCYNFASTIKAVSTDGSGAFSTSLTVPQSVSGLFYVQVVSTGAIMAQAGFVIDTMSETLTPNTGPEGTSIGVVATNLTPGQPYHVCFSLYSSNCSNGAGWVSTQVIAIATGSGTITATVVVPAPAVQGTYAVNTFPDGTPTSVLASSNFLVTPETLSISPSTGNIGSSVAVGGTGYQASTTGTYFICFTQYPGNVCYNFSSTQKAITTDGSGVFASSLTVPSNAFGTIYVEVISNGAIISQFPFQVTLSISLNPDTGTPGTAVTVTGSGFAPSSVITIKYDGAIQTTTPPTITSDSNGAFSATFNAPAGSPGTHAVSATDASANSASATFTLATISTTTTTETSTVTTTSTTTLPPSTSTVTTTVTTPTTTTTTTTETSVSTVTTPTTTTETTTVTTPTTTTQTVTSTETTTLTTPTTVTTTLTTPTTTTATVTNTETTTLTTPTTTTVTLTSPTTTTTTETSTETTTITTPTTVTTTFTSPTTTTQTTTETTTLTTPSTTTITLTTPTTTTQTVTNTETTTFTSPTTVTTTVISPTTTTETTTETFTLTTPTTVTTTLTTLSTTTITLTSPTTTTQTVTSTETSTLTTPTTVTTTLTTPTTTTETTTSTETTTLTTPTTVTSTLTTPTTTTETTTATTTLPPSTSTVTTTVTTPSTTTETTTLTSTVTSPTTSTVTSTVTSTSTETATTTLTSSTTATETTTLTSPTTTTETSTVTTPTTTTETTTVTSPTTTTQTVTSTDTSTSTETLTSTSISTVTTPTTTTVTNTVTSETTTTATSTETSTQTSTVTTPSTTTVTTTQTTPTTTTLTTTETSTLTSPTTSTATTTLTSTSTVTSQTTSTVTATTTVVSPTTTTVSVTTVTTVTSTVTTTVGPPLLPSITSLTCDPSQVEVGHQATCKAVVTGSKNAPTGTVAFSSTGTGSFGSVSCSGSHNGDNANAVGVNDNGNGNSLTCSVKYNPSTAGPQTITGAYSGDAVYSTSVGTFLLNAASQGDQAVGLSAQPAEQNAIAISGDYLSYYGQNLNALQTTHGVAVGASVRAGR
jgi:hypothetical protein